MKSKWNVVPLRNLIGFISKGIAPAYAEDKTETTIRVLNQKCNRNFQISYSESRLHDVSKKRVPSERYVKQNDILINSTGTGTAGRIAQINYVPCETTVDGHMIIIRANEKVTQRYLGCALKAHQREVLQLDEGSTGQKELNRERLLEEIMISYPESFDEQEKIVALLNSLDNKIQQNNKINDNLQQQARALLAQWIIEHDGDYKFSLLSDIAAINPDTYSPKVKWEYVNYLDTSSITDGIISEVQYINPSTEKLPSRARRIISANDVVFSTVRPNQRHFGMISEPLSNMLASTGFAVIRNNQPSVCNELLYLCLTENNFVEKMQQLAEQSTSTFPSIKPSDLGACEIPCPIDQGLSDALKAMFANISSNRVKMSPYLPLEKHCFQSSCPANWMSPSSTSKLLNYRLGRNIAIFVLSCHIYQERKSGENAMPESYTENNFENAVLEIFRSSLGYNYLYGPNFERDYRKTFYESALRNALSRINTHMPHEAVAEALSKLENLESGSLLQKNMIFMEYLQNGIPVKFFENGTERSSIVRLLDYHDPSKNDFIVANQWTFIEHSEIRPDIILFVNGLPLVVIELKSPSREETDASAAYRQLRNYFHEIPTLFAYNAICVMSDMTTSKAGTITSGEDRFMEWKTKDGSYENTQYAAFDTFFEGMFEKERLLDILKNFICFDVDGLNTFKILAAYHQYFAVKKAVASTRAASAGNGKGGVFWHTQGSGKSLSMVFYAHALQEAMESPTIIVLTDRNDLDDQLYGNFQDAATFFDSSPSRRKVERICMNFWPIGRPMASSSPPCKNLRKVLRRYPYGKISSLWRTRRTVDIMDWCPGYRPVHGKMAKLKPEQ